MELQYSWGPADGVHFRHIVQKLKPRAVPTPAPAPSCLLIRLALAEPGSIFGHAINVAPDAAYLSAMPNHKFDAFKELGVALQPLG